MYIKVCGMKDPENIRSLTDLPIHFMGLIFYPRSPRYAGDREPLMLRVLPDIIRKVGVFVNEAPDIVINHIDRFELNYVQLHGNESPEYIDLLRSKKEVGIIKAFSISGKQDLKAVEMYGDGCDYFLFDTKTPGYGGSGLQFDWNILTEYNGNIPFFLSGGISVADAERIKEIDHPQLYALDLNSKFEISPGIKDISLINQFIKQINDEQN